MEFLTEYNLTGLVIGIATFLIIGLFHPLVVKGEYYLGVRCWWVFLVMGIVAIVASVAVRHILWSTLLAVWGASCPNPPRCVSGCCSRAMSCSTFRRSRRRGAGTGSITAGYSLTCAAGFMPPTWWS